MASEFVVGDVVHARVAFVGRHGYKWRPALVVGHAQNGDLLCAMVTSATNALSDPYDVPVQDWEQAGLEKPSLIRSSRIVFVPEGALGTGGCFGHLSDRDLSAAVNAMARLIADRQNEIWG